MKLLLGFFLLAVLFATPAANSVADEVCVRKVKAGEISLGTVFEVPESCEKCACDGAFRKFCMVDPACKRDREAMNKRPCYKGGSKFEHGSQVQVDCNICLCNNNTWDCTKEQCNYGGGISEEINKEDSSCVDSDSRCENWIKRKGKELCEVKKYVQKKCLKSCDRCEIVKEDSVVDVEKPVKKKKEVCKDKNDNCYAWSTRDGNLCQTHKFMIAKCKVTCGLCTPDGAEAAEEEEDNEVTEEEEEEEQPREKTKKELEEERRQAEIAAWRNRLIEEGQLVDTEKTPQGCMFDCGGTVYPWGSSLQDSHCGVCDCKRKGKHNYFFKCTNPECETNPTCN